MEVVDGMHAGRIVARVELFQRLILMFLLGVIPLVVDPDVLASFVDTKFLMIQLLVLFALAAGAVKLAAGGLHRKETWTSIPLLLLLALYFAHVQTDPVPRYALVRAMKFGIFLFLPLLFVSAFRTPRQQRQAEAFLIFMSVPMLLYGIAQYLNFELFEYLFEAKKSSVHGTLGNSHFFGGYLAILVFILLNRILQVRSSTTQLLYIFTLVIVVFLLVVSKSRGAMLCMGLAVFGFWGVRAWAGWSETRKPIWTAALAAWVAVWIAVPAVLWYTGPKAETHLVRKVELKFHRDRSFNNRLVLGLVSIQMWAKNPLWGVGLDRYPVEYFDALYQLASRPDNQVVHHLIRLMESTQANEAHNDFLQTLAETGVAGFVLQAGICCVYLAGLGLMLRHRHLRIARRDLILVSCLLPSLLTVIAQMNYSFPLHLPANAVQVFMVLGWSGILFRRYGVLEWSRPRWVFHPAVRWPLALALAVFAGWGSLMTLRQYMGLVELRVGYLLLEQFNDPRQAMEHFRNAGILTPENGEVDFCKAQVFSIDGEQLRLALDMLDQAEKTFTNSSIRLVRSQLYIEMFRFSEALRVLEPLSKITERLEKLHLARGMVRYHDGQFAAAVPEFEAELEINPRSEKALLYLAQSHYELGNYFKAAELFNQAYRRHITSIEVAERLGDIYSEHQFRPKQAREFYAKALNWALSSKRGQDARRLERKIEKLERKIRLKMENPQFRIQMQSQ